MSDSTVGLRRKISSAGDLQSVVRSMKALAASSVGQYEMAVVALDRYYRTVELGLGACIRQCDPTVLESDSNAQADEGTLGAIVFGSDQGLVGQFNEVVADFTIETLVTIPGRHQVWAVGERVHARLQDAGLEVMGLFPTPNSVEAITPLVGQVLVKVASGTYFRVHLFHNGPTIGSLYEPRMQRLLPFDTQWEQALAKVRWPSKSLPEIIGSRTSTLRALIQEYLFISLFKGCAESLAAENASRLAAMERADRNIDELLGHLNDTFHRLRQGSIDEEIFDVITGFEALSTSQ